MWDSLIDRRVEIVGRELAAPIACTVVGVKQSNDGELNLVVARVGKNKIFINGYAIDMIIVEGEN